MTVRISRAPREPLASGPGRRQESRQDRTELRRGEIAQAAVELLAEHGVAGVTHRMVASRAGVPLAATTYHFGSKFDIIAEASRRILQGSLETLRSAARRCEAEAKGQGRLRALTVDLICHAASRDRVQAICWAEIMLDAARHDQSRALTHQWFDEVSNICLQRCKLEDPERPAKTARSAMDLVIGLMLVTTALGLSPDQISKVLEGGANPLDVWAVPPLDPYLPEAPRRTSSKAAATHDRILRAAIDALIEQGPAAASYRAVAARAGLAPAGPYYHFPTINGLLAAAQRMLFEESKRRYRSAAAQVSGDLTAERLIDRTAIVLVREATEFAASSIASYAIWLQAARDPELRPMVWSAIADQYAAWRRLLAQLQPDQRSIDALVLLGLFVGKHVRILSAGSQIDDLAMIRSELARDIALVLSGRFWL